MEMLREIQRDKVTNNKQLETETNLLSKCQR